MNEIKMEKKCYQIVISNRIFYINIPYFQIVKKKKRRYFFK